jgi:hypothetical protein
MVEYYDELSMNFTEVPPKILAELPRKPIPGNARGPLLLYLEAKTKPLYSAHTMRRIGKISSLLWIGGLFTQLPRRGILGSSR